MRSGTARWVAGGRSARLGPGQVLLNSPRTISTLHWDATAGQYRDEAAVRHTVHAYVAFDLSSGDIGSDWPKVVTLPDSPDVRHALLYYLLQLGRTLPAGWQEPAGATLETLLCLLERGTLVEPDSMLELPESVQRLTSYVRRAWRHGIRPVPLDEMAEAAGISKGHLCRQFRADFGLGPAKAFELLRLGHAAALLRRSNLTVVQAADACGYTNPYHFSRSFRAAFGQPPSVYRTVPDDSCVDAVFDEHNLTTLAARVWAQPAPSADDYIRGM